MTLPEVCSQPASGPTSAPVAARARRPWPIHPLLLAAYPTLALLDHNRHEARWAWAVLPLLLSIAGSGILWCFLGFLLRSATKGALATSLAVLFFFSFGHLTAVLERLAEVPTGESYGQLLFAELGLLVLMVALLRATQGPLAAMTRFANVTALVVVALPLLSLAWMDISVWRDSAAARSASRRASMPIAVNTGSSYRPDIYLIVPDAHARADVMKDVYGYDMEPFLTELEQLGFVVADRSTSNYSLTPKSLASMLNCRYLHEYDELSSHSFQPYAELIRDSTLVRALKSAGYKTVAFPTGTFYSEMEHFDVYQAGGTEGAMFHRLYAELTPLGPILTKSVRWNDYVTRGEQILRILQALPETAADPDPTFAFVHLAIPHPPFRFDEDGNDVFPRYHDLNDNGKGGREEHAQARYREAYRGQAIFTDGLLLDAIRGILSNSSEPPVILLVSDHGPRLNTDWDRPEQTDVREAVGNLTAVYLPNARGAQVVYPTITPANLMRVVLNEIFGGEIPMLPDRSFLSVNAEGWYRLVEVTDRLESRGAVAPTTSAAGPAR